MSKPVRVRLVTTLKIVAPLTLGAGILAFLIWWNWDDLHKLRLERWDLLPVAFVLCFSATLLTFVRWYLLVWAQGLPFRVGDALRIGFIGYLFNQIIPGAVGGDLVKAVLLAREQSRRTVAISTIVIDRIVGMYALALVACVASLAFWQYLAQRPRLQTIGAGVIGVVGVGSIIFALLFTPLAYRAGWTERLVRLRFGGGLVREVLHAMAAYHSRKRVVMLAVAMSVLIHIGFVSSLYCTAASLRVSDTSPSAPRWPAPLHFAVAPLGLSVNAIPVIPGGVGLGEGAMQTLFGWADDESGSRAYGFRAFGMMLTFRVMCWAIAAIGVRYLIASFRETRRAMAEAGSGGASAEPVPAAGAS